MNTIGKLLKSLRIKSKLTLKNISDETNIPVSLLEYLEKDDYKNLPSSTFTKGFIISYAKIVGLSSEKALAIFRRDFEISELGKIMPRGLAKPLDKKTIITSKLGLTFILIFLMISVLGYFIFQLYHYQAPPTLEVIKPKAYTVLRGPIITVSGFVSTDSSLFVNGKLIEVYPTGEFRTTISVPNGDSEIKIRAVDSRQKVTQLEIPITVVDN